MSSCRIPFNKPCLTGKELSYIVKAVSSGHISGDGGFTRLAQRLLEQQLPAPRVLLTTSCTHALEMAALLLDIQPGDEVIVPAFTFVSTVNAFVLRGAKPVFADIRPDTLNLDERRLPQLITPRTRAIIPVHYAGVGCEMDEILRIARANGVAVVEDNAHGLFGCYRGKRLGTFGCLATLSFHETKNIICGEGGALIINDAAFIDPAEIVREKGTNRGRFFRGLVDKYTWVGVGSSYVLSDLLAAFLLAQLESSNQISSQRALVWHYYEQHLREWAAEHNVQLPHPPPECEQSYHMFYMILPSPDDQEALIEHLRERGILSVFHYQPLHLSEMGQRFGGWRGQCPVTERISGCLVRLPFYNDLAESQQREVIQAIAHFDGWRSSGAAEVRYASQSQ
ncbi:MAG TPA: dTDP-4-amino-4,6-dideoxygalactose transaminase [Bryobacteraceae bacterium]|nr:dTDP-4-amino-4,6-dideoxygalactose transaminase [Bryobacteraceae bacterium]